MRYRAPATLTEWTRGWAVRLQFMKATDAPMASRANQTITYSGLLPPSRATISPFFMPRSFMSQFPIGCIALKISA